MLFAPILVLVIAAVAGNQPATKHRFLKSVGLFVCMVVVIVPIRMWTDLFHWLFSR